MNVSFIIASCRPSPVVQKTIDSINSIKSKYNYEICIYSPYYIKDNNVKFFLEEKPNGPHFGFNFLIQNTKGEYIIQLVDDQIVWPDVFNAISFIESDIFINRKYKICTLACGNFVGLEWPLPNGEMIPNHLCMRFPVISKDTLKNYMQNFLYHPDLYYHQGDAWLGYWLAETGEPGLECYNANTRPHATLISNTYDKNDTQTYFDLIYNFKRGNTKYVERI